MDQPSAPYWSMTSEEVLKHLRATAQGLSSVEAKRRLVGYGPNILRPRARTDALALLAGQLKSPASLILKRVKY